MQKLSLLWELTKANLKVQNENSYLGILWYLLGPLLLFGILLVVFSGRLGARVEHYPLYLLLGIVLWNFFATATGRAMSVLQSNAGLLKTLPVKKELLVLSVVLTALVSHIFELMVYAAISLWFGVVPTGYLVFALVLLLSVTFTVGISFFLAGVFVHFRDVGQIWSIISRVWWFATPIFYVLTPTGPGRVVSQYNPLYLVITLGRDTLIYSKPVDTVYLGLLALYAVVSLIVGYAVFVVTTRRAFHLL